MNGIDALKEAYNNGKCVRQIGWEDKTHIKYESFYDNFVLWKGNERKCTNFTFSFQGLYRAAWEIYEKKPEYREVSFKDALEWCYIHPECSLTSKNGNIRVVYMNTYSQDRVRIYFDDKGFEVEFKNKWLIPEDQNDE